MKRKFQKGFIIQKFKIKLAFAAVFFFFLFYKVTTMRLLEEGSFKAAGRVGQTTKRSVKLAPVAAGHSTLVTCSGKAYFVLYKNSMNSSTNFNVLI